MNTSLFELFKIGIGPSSSHTVGPMRAALRFLRELDQQNLIDRVSTIQIDLYGANGVDMTHCQGTASLDFEAPRPSPPSSWGREFRAHKSQ